MSGAKPQQHMYELTSRGTAQRVTLAVLLAAWLALAWWLLFGGGIVLLSNRLGMEWNLAEPLRRALLGAAFTVYFVRVLFTVFAFLRRGMGWAETFTIAPWVLCVVLLLTVTGSTNTHALGAAAAAGAALFVLGSWMNTFAEFQRHRWKQRPENRGQLYTLGLFRFSRHPNYLGDLLSFSGTCLLAGRWITAVVPVLMLCGFVFVNIPALDAHLRERYGAAFERYARTTRKLIPFLY
ncbi:MAG TPA: DUF1295 domain-containing protein [Terracidiphilus sp.]|nr:DUF1295 domain-containing protein [Terracidiphilus sp.]